MDDHLPGRADSAAHLDDGLRPGTDPPGAIAPDDPAPDPTLGRAPACCDAQNILASTSRVA
jgi:hypothetical protein